MKKPKIYIQLANPKNYVASMLFFGCLFEILGIVAEPFTANSALSQAGWILIAVSAFLWIAELMSKTKSRRYRR